jgi:hypothetical protein
MPPVIINGTYQIILVWGLNGNPYAQNSLHAQIPGGASVNQALADSWATDLDALHDSSGLAAVQPASITLDRVGLRDLRTANQPLIESPVNSAGTGTGDLLARALSVVVTMRTALAGKSFRGRSYVPGFNEAQNAADGTIAASATSAANAWITGIRTAATARGHTLAVGSPTLGISTPVTAQVVRDSVWDVQRRRGYNGV